MAKVTATFHDRYESERAIEELAEAGIEPHEITVIAAGESHGADISVPNVAKGAAGGSAVGGSLGAIAGGLLAGGALVVATGGAAAPIVIGAPIAGALAGGGAGAAVGSLIGAVVGAGVPDPAARPGDERGPGGITLEVQADYQNVDTIRDILDAEGAPTRA
jgi:hypothetical protein